MPDRASFHSSFLQGSPNRSRMRMAGSLHRPLLERLWQRDLPPHLWPLWAALAPASALYSVALAIRERWWRSMARHAGVTTISVGNLTVGGNGKTPFTLFLAVRLRAQGLNVGIVSRGWGRRGSGAQLVSDGPRILLGPDVARDEPGRMARCFVGRGGVARRRIDAVKLPAERCPLAAVTPAGGKRSASSLIASIRRRATAIGPSKHFAIITGSSPATSGPSRIRAPSETSCAPLPRLPHPRLTIPTFRPCAPSRTPRHTVNGVFP